MYISIKINGGGELVHLNKVEQFFFFGGGGCKVEGEF